jgi:hypothetical protein
MRVLGESLPAGQLGAQMSDGTSGKFLLLFVTKTINENQTLVKASIEPDSHGQKTSLLKQLLGEASSIVSGKGFL